VAATRLGVVALAAVIATSVAGCGAGASHSASSPGPGPAAHAAADGAVAAPAATAATSRHHAQTGTRSGTAARAVPAGQQPASQTRPRSGLRGDAPYVWSIHATVTPTCVRAGGTARLDVRTAANAAVAYVAMYAGDKSGATPPFGQGYGGNSDGYTSDPGGRWSDTWTIRADAPRGHAHVIVVVASHQTTQRVDVPFTVVDPLTGTC
jgi:hypothetical protein